MQKSQQYWSWRAEMGNAGIGGSRLTNDLADGPVNSLANFLADRRANSLVNKHSATGGETMAEGFREGLRVERDGRVGMVIMDRPPHNFLSYRQVHDIADAMVELENDMSISCAVLVAEGRSFCAGADLGGEGVGGGADEKVGGSATLQLYQGSGRLFDVTLPIVGAIHGPAIGGGLGLAMVPDIRVTCPEARFCANFASLGIHQGFGLSVTMPALVGPERAAKILLGAKRYKGDEAVELGLADECVPADQVRDRAIELAREIGANAPLAVRSIKATLRRGLGDKVREITQHEAAEQLRLSGTEDAREGMRAVAERRPGNFVGR